MRTAIGVSATGQQAQPGTFTVPVGFTPLEVRSAYGINAIGTGSSKADGSGQTIAIVDAYNDPRITADVNAFDKELVLAPDGPSIFKKYGPAKSFLTVLNQNGQKINPAKATAPSPDPTHGWEREESLDVEWAHAIAPGARIDLVEVGELDSLPAGVVVARRLPGVSVVSLSWGQPEFASEQSLDRVFAPAPRRPHVTFVAASGDQGSSAPWYPAFVPGVVAVGGTTLATGANNSYLMETGWSGSGGGISEFEPEPAYQLGVQNTGRLTTPDVVFLANPARGTAIYDSYDSASDPWEISGGTSLAAPCWAGLIAIANQMRVARGGHPLEGATQTLPALYSLPEADFHDVVAGSDGSFTAGAGYDEVTGLGSPVANLLVPALAAYGNPNRGTGARARLDRTAAVEPRPS
jgi:subtilase family serine protease